MGHITVIGVGFDKKHLTLEAIEALNSGSSVILHTERCGVAEYLTEKNIAYTSLDELYDTYEDFDEHAEAAAEAVELASENGDVVYCVMDIRDLSAGLLAENGATLISGPSAEGILMAYATDGTQFYSASDWENMYPDAGLNTIVREIDNKELACEVKLRLMESYPDDAECISVSAEGSRKFELHTLDRQADFDHRFSVFVRGNADISAHNDITFRRLVSAARANDDLYKEAGDDELADMIAKSAGAVAYAEDRGEFTSSDIMVYARDVILG